MHIYRNGCHSNGQRNQVLSKTCEGRVHKRCLLWMFCLVQFSCSVMLDSLWPHGLQHARPSCPSPTPRVYSNSCFVGQGKWETVDLIARTLTEGEFPDLNSGYLSLGKTNLYHCSKHSCPRFTYYASGWLHRGPLSCPLYLIRGGYLVTDTEENLIAFLITIAETQTGKANIQGPQNSEKGQLLGVMRKNH